MGDHHRRFSCFAGDRSRLPMTRREVGRAGAALAAAAAVLHWAPEQGAAATRPLLTVNQAGYLPRHSKVALLAVPGPLREISVVSETSGETVAAFPVGRAKRDPDTGVAVAPVDFSSVRAPGRYWLQGGAVQSHGFVVDDVAFDLTFTQMLRTYWLQRCGVAVRDPISGMDRAPCHQRDGVVVRTDRFNAAGTRLDGRGGWHDAGDFGKYVATTTTTIGRLLSLYEMHPDLFVDGQLAIPESGNGVPDLLDEMAWGLEWLMRMQRPDGAVYRKLSGAQWPGMVMPEADGQERYVYGVTSPETGKFAAVMAMAARLWGGRGDRYLAAARRAWAWLETVPPPQFVDWAEGDDGGSGKYLYAPPIDDEATLTHDRDDRIWAAAELYLTTGEAPFGRAFAALLPATPFTLFEWKDPSALGLTSYLFPGRHTAPAAQEDVLGLRGEVRTRLLARADRLLHRAAAAPWGLAIERLKWGSNKMIAEEGITLALAHRLTGRADYLAAAVGQLDWLLGRNPFERSFVTGVGSDPVRHIHHRVTQAQGIYVPGFLAGGPFPGATDPVAPKGRGLLSWIDDDRSYATNENAIDYNASMIGLIGHLVTSR
ncbi:MAG: glycoside hydrolase family 9 protein [Alphaproteobacteria bacterium]